MKAHICDKSRVNQMLQAGEIRRWMKLTALALARPLSLKGHGMGARQIAKVIMAISDISKERDKDDLSWFHADKKLIDEIALHFDRKNYDLMEGLWNDQRRKNRVSGPLQGNRRRNQPVL